jgi:hypothetical protein
MGNQIYFKIAGKKKNWSKGRTARHIFGREPSNDYFIKILFLRRLQLLIFFTEVIKFYWLMLLLYPGELYRLLGASSYHLRLHHFPLKQFFADHLSIFLTVCQKLFALWPPMHLSKKYVLTDLFFQFCNKVACFLYLPKCTKDSDYHVI